MSEDTRDKIRALAEHPTTNVNEAENARRKLALRRSKEDRELILTDTMISGLPVPAKHVYYKDKLNPKRPRDYAHGLHLRHLTGGTKSWVLIYSKNRLEHRITIGHWPEMKTETARAKARTIRENIAGGADPAMGCHEAKPSMATLCRQFLDGTIGDLDTKAPATRKIYSRQIAQWIIPKLGHRAVDEITTGECEQFLRRVTREAHARASKHFKNRSEDATEPGHVEANRAFKLLGKLFTVAVKNGLRDRHPIQGMEIELNPEYPRERYLTDAEWDALLAECEHLPAQYGSILRFCLWTGCRIGEAIRAEWSKVDTQAATWTKPARRVKQRRISTVTLNSEALGILEAKMQCGEPPVGRVFKRADGTPYSYDSVHNQWITRVRKAVPSLGDVNIHDLRHSAASTAISAGSGLHDVGKMLGHASITSTQRYAHLVLEAQRRTTDSLVARRAKTAKKPKERTA
jgi:integrase